MTDRTLRSTDDLDTLTFDADGLVPVVAQDASTGRVLMVAWANREALGLSLDRGTLHFWSRSRGTLWKKGETSGNTLALRSLHADCDADTVLAIVDPAGPACHTGEDTCFGAVEPGEATADPLRRLDATLAERARNRPAGSYTVKLLADANLRLKKLGEENAELLTALATGDAERASEEAADLVYHVLVALRAEGIGLERVLEALDARAG